MTSFTEATLLHNDFHSGFYFCSKNISFPSFQNIINPWITSLSYFANELALTWLLTNSLGQSNHLANSKLSMRNFKFTKVNLQDVGFFRPFCLILSVFKIFLGFAIHTVNFTCQLSITTPSQFCPGIKQQTERQLVILIRAQSICFLMCQAHLASVSSAPFWCHCRANSLVFLLLFPLQHLVSHWMLSIKN